MAEKPIDLFRFEGDGNRVVLRISGRDESHHQLIGEFRVDTPFVRGRLKTWIRPEDLGEWQKALDTLDAGYDISWRDGKRAPWLYIELDEDDDRCLVTITDSQASGTAVTVLVPLTDEWFDDAYRRLDTAWKILQPSKG